ncbi:MAG: AzlC family ABC transporter permease [Lachnospiraceae bacterium]|nr:AzlC family ABC transporter permease [Lachnospiraceae bacterium]
MKSGLPIGLGYFAVSLAVGIMARRAGVHWWQGALMSALTNASAGEYAGLQVMLEDSGIIMMILMTVVASARYFLMSSALSQHLDPKLSTMHRLLIAFDLTDETFGVEIAEQGYVQPVFCYGLFILPILGWSSGTAVGILMGELLPESIVNALSVALYGMFIAIIIPPAKKNKAVAIGVIASFALSFLASRLPGISDLSSGVRTIILTVIITAAISFLFPRKEEKEARQ